MLQRRIIVTFYERTFTFTEMEENAFCFIVQQYWYKTPVFG